MSPALPSPIKLSKSSMKNNRSQAFLSQLEREVCCKAKEAGKHPSYTDLVLSLVHNYSLDINRRVVDSSYSVFHCACLSCSLELVRALLPLADLQLTTARGDSALYLAVYAAAHRLRSLPVSCQDGLEIVQHLLEAGCDVNLTNKAGWSALHQASRLGHQRMIRLLLDWGAEMTSASNSKLDNTQPASRRHDSILSSCSSVVTRSMNNRRESSVNKSFLKRNL